MSHPPVLAIRAAGVYQLRHDPTLAITGKARRNSSSPLVPCVMSVHLLHGFERVNLQN
jgi:hypothetical protein